MPVPELPIGAIALALSLMASAVSAQKSVTASEAWVQLPAAGLHDARAFAIIDNPTMYDVYFVSGTAEVADGVAFSDAGANGVADALIKELTAPAYGKVALEPGGVHLILKGLKRSLQAGETIAITLSTETDAVTFDAVVKP